MHIRICLLILSIICFSADSVKAGDSPGETSVFELFKDMEASWNAQDSDGYMKFFHKDLKLKLGKPGNVKYYSWDEYAKILPGRMKKFGPFKMVNPKIIKLDGTRAKAEVIVRKKTRDYENIFNMVWEENRWQITSNEW